MSVGVPLKMIESINYDAQQFLTAVRRFRQNGNVIDQNLVTSLLSIVSEIDDFLETKPKVVQNPQVQLTAYDLKNVGIQDAFYCKQCKEKIGHSIDNVRTHLTSTRHLNPKKKTKISAKNPRPELLILPKKAKSLLLCDYTTFFRENMEVSKKLKNLREYETIATELTNLLSPVFPDQSVRVYTFGSRISGIGVIHSDLDIFVDIGGVMNVFENRASSETKQKLAVVEDVLKKNGEKWARLLAVRAARVPILKVYHKATAINCDIGFSNSLGFYNTRLMQYFMEIQPIVHYLSLFLRKWFERTKLNEHINSYSTILMVVYFLQMKKLLPSVKALQDNVEEHILVGPWVATFNNKSLSDLQIPQISNKLDTFQNELAQFFQFYGTFDFERKVICPYLGEEFLLDQLNDSPLIPRYVEYVKLEKESKESQFKKAFINIQDPYQLNNNTTKAVPQVQVLTMKQYFVLSRNILGELAPSKK